MYYTSRVCFSLYSSPSETLWIDDSHIHRPCSQLTVTLDLTHRPAMTSTKLGPEVLSEPDTDILMRRSGLQAGKEPPSPRPEDLTGTEHTPFFLLISTFPPQIFLRVLPMKWQLHS